MAAGGNGTDNLIVDAGDMLARVCNDVVPATTHRVVNPSGPNVSRYSMPFFMHPHPNAMLSCLESCKTAENDFAAKYPDITAGEFLTQRLREIGLVPNWFFLQLWRRLELSYTNSHERRRT